MAQTIHLGSRSSKLALWQSQWVMGRLQEHHPHLSWQLLPMQTSGDRNLHTPLAKIGQKGLFTKELDTALLRCEIDLAVHSLKDLPTAIPEGLTLGAVSQRGEVRDALLSREKIPFAQLPVGAVIATGSLRRQAQLLHLRPDLRIAELRGNVDTRLRKFHEHGWDGMVLAAVGLERLGLQAYVTELLSPELLLPAVGQGSLAIICRKDDEPILRLLQSVHHLPSAIAASAERAFLQTLEGGCQVPIGALGKVEGQMLTLTGFLSSLDGRQMLRQSLQGPAEHAETLGLELGQRLLAQGGQAILSAIRPKTSDSPKDE